MQELTNYEKAEKIVKYSDVCKEVIDGIFAENDIPEPVSLENIFDNYTTKKSILLPTWIKNTNAFEDLLEMGYLTRLGEKWGVSQKGYDLAQSCTFNFDKEYVVNIINQETIDILFRDIDSLK